MAVVIVHDASGASVFARGGFGDARYDGNVVHGGRGKRRLHERDHACPVVLGARDYHGQANRRTAVGHIGRKDVWAGRSAGIAGVVVVTASVGDHVTPDKEKPGPDGDVVPAAGRRAGPEGQDLKAAGH